MQRSALLLAIGAASMFRNFYCTEWKINLAPWNMAEDLQNRIDGALIHVLDGADHYPIGQEPDATV